MRHGPLRRPVPNLRSLAIRHTLHAVFYTGAPDERGFGSVGWLHRGPRRARVWLGGVVTPGPPTSEGLARWGGYTGAPDERGFGSVGGLHGRLARHHVDARRRREHKSRIRRRSIRQLPAEVELVLHPIRLVDLHRF